jgi:predicted DNA-binding transcriptional regulator AlpA
MPQRIEGVDYFSMAEVILATGVCRQTVWRWRKAGRIPQGRLFRERQILYTESEFRAICEFASRVEPVEGEAPEQLRLFGLGQR